MNRSKQINPAAVPPDGRAGKGSRALIQAIVNRAEGAALTRGIQMADPSVGWIRWLSPLAEMQYVEFQSGRLKSLVPEADLSFWPTRGPHWDAVGTDGHKLILVEAKSHCSETKSGMKPRSDLSREMIRQAMRAAHNDLVTLPRFGLVTGQAYDAAIWENTYYQLGNRLTYFARLNQQGIATKLILVNFVEDPTWQGTNQWTDRASFESHYAMVFHQLLGSPHPPVGVSLIYVDGQKCLGDPIPSELVLSK